ncbi:iron complex transport system substrate-binding protein [Peteryoungia aggregata LMG 23059]|uniref:Iron complex transport system substrate-binding protein n=1 Tax=Peteryoungia aggregata LMG 23059 TaxID=1368425 RepID=A0ABU0G8Y1_9HYPH|nr:ABC transporter substrate-binding protein [Peteryoungia aggregata]MDQ0421389.1 iron complex transport system substrate-binding protein [Peteryoungia aggregata LMG 23059]
MLSLALSRRHALSLASVLALGLPLAAPFDASADEAKRIVSIGGTVTEIIYALGEGDRIVAVDTTSLYPAEATSKPNIGYVRQVSAEGVLSQTPDLIVAEGGAGPVDSINILKASGLDFVSIASPPETATIPDKIRAVGQAVGSVYKAEDLAKSVEASLKAIEDKVKTTSGPKKKVLFALSLANGRVMAAGTESSADAMIRLAGGENAVSTVSGFKPLTDEAVIAAAPDVILVMSGGGQHLTAEQAFALPALAATPAGRNKAFLTMDGLYLLGLGPRAAAAAADLHAMLYPEASKP